MINLEIELKYKMSKNAIKSIYTCVESRTKMWYNKYCNKIIFLPGDKPEVLQEEKLCRKQ